MKISPDSDTLPGTIIIEYCNVVIIIMLTSGLCSAVQLVSWVKPRASQMVAASSRVQAGAQ